jgi:hypothetical protein
VSCRDGKDCSCERVIVKFANLHEEESERSWKEITCLLCVVRCEYYEAEASGRDLLGARGANVAGSW